MNWRSVSAIRPRDLTNVRFVLGDACFFGLAPSGGGRGFGFGYVIQPRIRDPLEGRLERLRSRYANVDGGTQEYLASLQRDDQLHCSAMEWIELDRWYAGRVVLVGDAAHASSPLMGQGGCMAMEDVCVLVEELRSAPTVESALSAFVPRRKARTRWVQQQSMALGEILRTPSDIRNAALRERGDQMTQARFRALIGPP